VSEPLTGLFESKDILERIGVDLTAQARRGDLEPVRCRDAEIARVIDILLRHGKNNPALVGKAGVGKTAIVEGLAQRIAADRVPPALKDARVIALDHVALLAGTSFRGQYEERIRLLVRALSADPDLILFVDELHNLIGQGTALGAAMDAANMLKPALVRGDVRVIGATTSDEYDHWIRGDPAPSKSWTRSRRGKSWSPGGRGWNGITRLRSRTTRSRPRSCSPTGSFPTGPAPTRPSTCWTRRARTRRPPRTCRRSSSA